MSRNNSYNNPFDEDDDGEDLEITDEDESASDDQGREEGAACVATMRSVRGRHRLDEEHRRMWFRMAKKALAVGAERRSKAEAAEKARVAAEEKAERERIVREAKEQRHRERFERSMRESDERWERLNEQTRRENAEWEAGREEREAAAARSAQVASGRTNAGREVPRPPTTTAASIAASTRPATKPVTTTTLPKPGSPTGVTVPGSTQPTRSPAGLRADQGSSGFRETPPSGHASQPPSPARTAPQPPRVEPERRVATSARPVRSPPSTLSPPATTRPTSPPVTPPATGTPTPTAVHPPPASASPSKGLLTGADLAVWRSARALTQRPAAALLGVAPSTVAKAELLPAKVLGEQLQVALAAAMKP